MKLNTFLRKKYIVPFVISLSSFWLMNKCCYLYRTSGSADALSKAMEIMDNPIRLVGLPVISFHSSDFLFPFLIAMMIYILIVTHKKRNLRSGKEHGSAKWAEKGEIDKFMDKDFKKNIILTKTEGLTLDPYIDHPMNGRNKNVLTVGSAGSGKTRFFVTPNIMQKNSSYVITDPKGTIIENVGTMLEKDGYNIKILNLINTKKSMHYNPLSYVHTELDVLKFGNMLVESTKSADEKADFWVKAERLLYQALVGLIIFEAPDEEKTMDTLIQLLNASEVSEEDENAQNAVDMIFEDLENENPEHFAVRQYKKYKLAAGKSAKSILISCGVRLSPFDIAEIRELTSSDDMQLDKLGDRKSAMFCITSDTDTSLNFIAAFLYMQMFNILCTVADDKYHGSLPVHVRCIFDEFRNIGKIPMFETLIATIRSRNISACPILQTKSQLKALYKDDAETIAGCCDSMLFLGGQEKSTLKDLSELLGSETVEVMNTSRTYGRQAGNSVNYQKSSRKLLDEAEIFKLAGDKCILTIRGANPWCSYKYDIIDHPNYKQLKDYDKRNAFDTEAFLKRYKKDKIDNEMHIDDEEEIVMYEFNADDFDEDEFI